MKNLLWILLMFSHTTFAAQIVVNSIGGGLGSSELCSLRAAINAANNDQPFSACPAGSGADTIILPENVLIAFFEVGGNNVGNAALPTVITDITIEGNNSVLTRVINAPNMRFFNVSGDGYLTLRDMTLKGGYGNSNGGAISSYSSLVLEGVKVIDNEASFSGGGIYCVNDYCEINNSVIQGNSASYGGGLQSTSDLRINNSLFTDNTAFVSNRLAGGAIFIGSYNRGFHINNSTISNNHSGNVGGIVIEESHNSLALLENLTITGNEDRGLVVSYDFIERSAYIKNSIISDNEGNDCSSTVLYSLGHNLIEDNQCSQVNDNSDIFNFSANLGPLINNGGPTRTHAPSYSSQAIDSGSDDCGDFDQRGFPRPQDGNDDGQSHCDIGAVELINRIIFRDGFE